MSNLDVREVAVDEIFIAAGALRECDQNSEDFHYLVDSIKKEGVLQPLTVRQVKGEDGSDQVELVDGLQRWTAAKEAGLETVPCIFKVIADGEVLRMQVVHNLQRIDTKPLDFANAMRKMLEQDPSMTVKNLADLVSYSEAWVEKLLNLDKLTPAATKLVADGHISTSNAIQLSTLRPEYQDNELENAQTMGSGEFTTHVDALKKEIRKALREGRDPSHEFQPRSILRKKSELEEEAATGRNAARLCAEYSPESLADAFQMGVAWTLTLDPEGKESQIAANKEKEEKARRKSEDRKLELAKKRSERAELRQKRTTFEVKLLEDGKTPEQIEAELRKFDEIHGLVKVEEEATA